MVPCCGLCRDRKLPTLRWLRRWVAGQPAIFCLSPVLRSLAECQKTHMEAFNLAGWPSASGGDAPSGQHPCARQTVQPQINISRQRPSRERGRAIGEMALSAGPAEGQGLASQGWPVQPPLAAKEGTWRLPVCVSGGSSITSSLGRTSALLRWRAGNVCATTPHLPRMHCCRPTTLGVNAPAPKRPKIDAPPRGKRLPRAAAGGSWPAARDTAVWVCGSTWSCPQPCMVDTVTVQQSWLRALPLTVRPWAPHRSPACACLCGGYARCHWPSWCCAWAPAPRSSGAAAPPACWVRDGDAAVSPGSQDCQRSFAGHDSMGRKSLQGSCAQLPDQPGWHHARRTAGTAIVVAVNRPGGPSQT